MIRQKSAMFVSGYLYVYDDASILWNVLQIPGKLSDCDGTVPSSIAKSIMKYTKNTVYYSINYLIFILQQCKSHFKYALPK